MVLVRGDIMNSTAHECSILEWLETNEFEVIDDSQTEVFADASGLLRVLSEDGQWRIVKFANRNQVIAYEMTFSKSTPAKIVIAAIRLAI